VQQNWQDGNITKGKVMMRMQLSLFRAMLIVGFAVVGAATYRAVTTMGADAAGDIFFGDMAHPWRGQFNVDFGFHLLLVASWMMYRARSLASGALFGLLAIFAGAIFTFPYVLIATIRAAGDMRIVLLGRHAGNAQ
jgi:hypothetical protein